MAHTYGQSTHAHTRTHTRTHTLADRHKSSTNTALMFTRTKHILAVRLKVGNTKDTKHDTSTYMHDVLAVAVGVAFCNFRWLLPWPLVSSVGRGGGVVAVVGVKWQHLWLCLSIRQI